MLNVGFDQYISEKSVTVDFEFFDQIAAIFIFTFANAGSTFNLLVGFGKFTQGARVGMIYALVQAEFIRRRNTSSVRLFRSLFSKSLYLTRT